MAFNLVRGSSERVSTSLKFRATANSTSIEVAPEDNRWEAEVQLIKEADLQVLVFNKKSLRNTSNKILLNF